MPRVLAPRYLTMKLFQIMHSPNKYGIFFNPPLRFASEICNQDSNGLSDTGKCVSLMVTSHDKIRNYRGTIQNYFVSHGVFFESTTFLKRFFEKNGQ